MFAAASEDGLEVCHLGESAAASAHHDQTLDLARRFWIAVVHLWAAAPFKQFPSTVVRARCSPKGRLLLCC
ncbi:hypothetical protein ACLOJK_004135 [Asimina triloba]